MQFDTHGHLKQTQRPYGLECTGKWGEKRPTTQIVHVHDVSKPMKYHAMEADKVSIPYHPIGGRRWAQIGKGEGRAQFPSRENSLPTDK